MLAKNFSSEESEKPTRPYHPRPTARFEAVTPVRTRLMLVRTPSPTPRNLAWARRQGTPAPNRARLQAMLRMELSNRG